MPMEYRRSRAPVVLGILLIAAVVGGTVLYQQQQQENEKLRGELAALQRPGTAPATNTAPAPTPTPEPAPTPTPPAPEPAPATDPCTTDLRARYQGRAIGFCYPLAWGRSSAQPTDVASNMRRGMEYVIAFTGSGVQPDISYATSNFALIGDIDAPMLPRTIDLQQTDEQLRAIYTAFGRVDGMTRIVVGGRSALRVDLTMNTLDGAPVHRLIYLVPNAFTVDGTALHILIQGDPRDAALLDRLVSTFTFR
ncbi:hypothetical protein HYV74_01740 [Candidatus Uhrbacteria bacterium]|nr:hypothetical protein [Candidatus Uhrbacteria bacterium]